MATGLQSAGLIDLGYGYVVEARKEHELPEVIICACELLKISEAKAQWFPPRDP